MDATTPAGSAGSAAQAPPPKVLDELSNVLNSARETLSGLLDLFSLEARRAGLALVGMIVAGLAAVLCIATGWLWLMSALAMFAVALGLVPMAAAILTAAISLAAGAALIVWCIGASRNLLFAATRRQLTGASSTKASQP
jgi:uncharacterized membrane protein YqjE